MPVKRQIKRKKKEKKIVPFVIAHIHSSFNNTIITLTDSKGDTVCSITSGAVGFKGTRKGTPFAAQIAAENLAKKAKAEFGVSEVDIRVQGPGSGRETAIRALQAHGLEVRSIKDVTPIPHNGCRPPKRRRT
ncbi:MAG: 30S ribosomal protein S11 [candidate division WS2 bacterium]|uniref:Small ribosomal subunit protein uS11 n=1 Tax=Psychracetigena formicireducens TaxID=2986056 RepID=A0A9E2BHH0_PSYF1|nr:30S ribosomal protein S11 [Candidatus Psychracetigena formicireducens]MBT9144681.1 30S ribosomal protein S11 [Candidatus Psychracetigena formicireducens]MBT9150197.1 30S ribosomal protein S11 [Candidatus Psychracetigena formicireducens]